MAASVLPTIISSLHSSVQLQIASHLPFRNLLQLAPEYPDIQLAFKIRLSRINDVLNDLALKQIFFYVDKDKYDQRRNVEIIDHVSIAFKPPQDDKWYSFSKYDLDPVGVSSAPSLSQLSLSGTLLKNIEGQEGFIKEIKTAILNLYKYVQQLGSDVDHVYQEGMNSEYKHIGLVQYAPQFNYLIKAIQPLVQEFDIQPNLGGGRSNRLNNKKKHFLEDRTVKELRDLARSRKVKAFSTMNKANLIKTLRM